MSNSNNDTPFKVINTINSKEYDQNKAFSGYLTDLYFSNYKNSIFLANEINNYSVSADLHYDYYFHSVKKNRRTFKWNKKQKADKYIDDIARIYNINRDLAHNYILLMSEKQIQELIGE
jgi:hypothetical protein